MTEQFPVASNHQRDSAGIPRHLMVTGAFTLTVALVVGGGTFAASADEVPVAATEASSSDSLDSSDLADIVEEVADNATVRQIAREAVNAAQGQLSDTGNTAAAPTEPVTDPAAEPTAEPTDPSTEPVPPAEPTDPATDPTEPTNPATDPTDPAEPTDPTDPTEPPAEPTDPTDPPVDETDPPTDPTEPTDPPVDETDPPVDETDPPTGPAEPTDPPAEDTGVPVPPVDPTTPPTVAPPAPEPDPIPVRPRVRPNPAAEAAAEAAREAAAERAAAVARAQMALDTARRAYDEARRAFAAATADHDAAQLRADQIHELATDAETRALRSERALTALVRALVRQSGNAAAGVLLDSRAGGDILYQLGTLDKLSNLTGNVEVIRARAEADRARADKLAADDAAAQEVLASIPLEAARAASDEARVAFEAASAELASLRTSAPVGLVGLTPLTELLAADTGQLSDQGWAHPAIGRISDAFGPRPVRPVPGVGLFHHGTDIGAACDAGVYAATSGVVVAAGSQGTYGNWILIDHGDGIETGYAHVAGGEMLVAVGEPVIAGQVIAGVGSTGASTGCHLHFEVRIDGTRVDAEAFMAERGVVLGAK